MATEKDLDTRTAAPAPVSATGDLRNFVLDALGREICAGEIAPDSTFTTESIEDRFQVSRPVVREALRGLQTLGLVTPKRRVGVRVLALPHWNVYDLQVIRWRLAGPSRVAQLRSLTELRGAIEPSAARLAAIRAPLNEASDLVGLAGRLWAAGKQGDSEEFLRLDLQFHQLILKLSGNEMFAQLHHLVEEVLRSRTQYNLMPQFPAAEALQWHVDIATGIQTGNAEKAAQSMIAITERALDEMSSLWDREG
ncbi:FCD domain-containing protein [Microbacterium sp.]|uniref:FadR/GntR family transcriptional regulator n=1 Tax=Microbacterium sp. TaxID=51671 RepID=UPI00262E3D6F|nr:FCD domain-containing protein [Microbacterium sp.]